MATSNSFDFSNNRDEVVKAALITCGVMRPDEDIKSYNLSFCVGVLNRMVKHMQVDTRQLWVHKVGYLFLAKDQHKYTFGTDHIATSVSTTELRVAGATSDVTLEVDSTTGMTAADFIGVQLDDGTMDWTTISSVTDSDTVVLTAGLDSAAAIDNAVYWYTNKTQDPIRITQCVYHYYEGNDAQMDEISRQEYFNLANKTHDSRPSQWYFDPQLSAADIYIYGEPEDVKDYILVHYQKPFDDMDASANDFNFPSEATETLVLQLAKRLLTPYRVPSDKANQIRFDAEQSKEEWSSFDRETATLTLRPAKNGR